MALKHVSQGKALDVEWYCDIISPFAYLQLERYFSFFVELNAKCCPTLLAGLLKHWQHKGPAEIGAKRLLTYRFVSWQAKHDGIVLNFPPAHPFNPLPLLRLMTALGNDISRIREIFRFVWQDGLALDGEPAWAVLAKKLDCDVDQLHKLSKDPAIKQQLIDNGQQAIARGVFGVPTCIVSDQLFWGYDASEMMLAFIEDPDFFATKDMQRLEKLPISASRI